MFLNESKIYIVLWVLKENSLGCVHVSVIYFWLDDFLKSFGEIINKDANITKHDIKKKEINHESSIFPVGAKRQNGTRCFSFGLNI